MEEVVSSNLTRSTKFLKDLRGLRSLIILKQGTNEVQEFATSDS
jgi:hypothetical protein